MDLCEFKDNLMYTGSSSQSRLYVMKACLKRTEGKEGEVERKGSVGNDNITC